jgi:hypothetical protein
MDIETLQKMPITRTGEGHIHVEEGNGVRASADGRVFGIWRNHSNPQGVQTLVLQGTEARGYYQHATAGHLLPGPDGNVLYTAAGRFTSQVKPLGDRRQTPPYCLPAAEGDFYLTIDGLDPPFSRPPKKKEARGTFAIHLAGDERPITTLPEVEPPAGVSEWSRPLMSADKRVHFIPSANLIVTIPDPPDRLVLHRFDALRALEKSEIDYLLITSRPPASVQAGTTLSYPIAARSKKGGLEYQLQSGPKGMTVSPAGLLTWAVPAGVAAGDVDVLVSVHDAAGLERLHRFTLQVRR